MVLVRGVFLTLFPKAFEHFWRSAKYIQHPLKELWPETSAPRSALLVSLSLSGASAHLVVFTCVAWPAVLLTGLHGRVDICNLTLLILTRMADFWWVTAWWHMAAGWGWGASLAWQLSVLLHLLGLWVVCGGLLWVGGVRVWAVL